MFVCGCAGPGNGKYCCPKIYFNHRCFSGPYLNKGRIAELPQFIGPGNCVLVLKEVSRREFCWQRHIHWWQHHGGIHGKAIKHLSLMAAVQKIQSKILKHPNAVQVLRGSRMQIIVLICFVCTCEREFRLHKCSRKKLESPKLQLLTFSVFSLLIIYLYIKTCRFKLSLFCVKPLEFCDVLLVSYTGSDSADKLSLQA